MHFFNVLEKNAAAMNFKKPAAAALLPWWPFKKSAAAMDISDNDTQEYYSAYVINIHDMKKR